MEAALSQTKIQRNLSLSQQSLLYPEKGPTRKLQQYGQMFQPQDQELYVSDMDLSIHLKSTEPFMILIISTRTNNSKSTK